MASTKLGRWCGARRQGGKLGPFVNLAVGAVAGVINVMMTTPLWGVMTVLTTQRTRGIKDGQTPYKGMLDGLIRCGKEEGVSGLWKGVTTNLILVSNPTVHYFICEHLSSAVSISVSVSASASVSVLHLRSFADRSILRHPDDFQTTA